MRYSVLFKTVFCSAIFFALAVTTAQAQTNTQRGAISGGAAGAIIGGIVGNQNNETAEGALIGGAIGALTGSLLGSDRDRQIQQEYYFQQQQAVAYRNGLSMSDAIALTANGVGSEVIINQIQINGVQQRIGVNEIIALHKQGVDNRVIDAMQRAPLSSQMVQRPPSRVQHYPVVAEPVFVPQVIWAAPPRPRHHHYHRPYRNGASLHFHYRR